MLIGLALALMLCISPVVAAKYEAPWDEYGHYEKYRYRALYNQSEEYITIWTEGTLFCDSFVTFKPANIPDAPDMVVNTFGQRDIYLPQSVDEWEIKYYSRFWYKPTLEGKYLKREGVVNLNEEFRESLSHGEWLNLELSNGQYIFTLYSVNGHINGEQWDFPEVKK
jgi:hypothetical protein